MLLMCHQLGIMPGALASVHASAKRPAVFERTWPFQKLAVVSLVTIVLCAAYYFVQRSRRIPREPERDEFVVGSLATRKSSLAD